MFQDCRQNNSIKMFVTMFKRIICIFCINNNKFFHSCIIAIAVTGKKEGYIFYIRKRPLDIVVIEVRLPCPVIGRMRTTIFQNSPHTRTGEKRAIPVGIESMRIDSPKKKI